MSATITTIDELERESARVLARVADDAITPPSLKTAPRVAIDAVQDRIEARERIARRYQQAGATVGDHPWP